MFQPTMNLIREECSGAIAMDALRDICRFHRIQVSPGYRQAAEYVLGRLKDWGVPAELLSFRSDHGVQYGGELACPEWSVREGTLHVIEPGDAACKLADYREIPLNLIPRSIGVSGDFELVALPGRGEDPRDYEGLEVAGKVVVANGNVMRVHTLAVQRFGAAGILFDGMREVKPVRPYMALPDDVQYTSFWWCPEDKPCFGFAISPRQGAWLRRQIAQQGASGKTVRVRARVDAELHSGHFEDVTAWIPGEGEEEVLVVCHLCHPKPSANDNASGAAAAMEAARSLHALVAAGKLPVPKRTIRFLWVPEMTGTYAYLAKFPERIPKTVAGLNLDMVGEDQQKTGSVMLIEHPSEALAGFAPAVLERLREEFFPEAKSHAGVGGFPLFRHAVTSFSGGSDHYILSDPQVGICTPMLIQWPDKFYHTSADTPDKVDPQSLQRAAALAAAYAYWVARAGTPEAQWLGHELSTRFKHQVLQQVQRARTSPEEPASGDLHARVAHQLDRQRTALGSLTRLGACDPSAWCEDAEAFVARELPPGLKTDPPIVAPVVEGGSRVPRRLFRMPVSLRSYARRMPDEDRDAYWAFEQEDSKDTAQTIALYWVDGRRSLANISNLVAWETGLKDPEMLAAYFGWLEKMGIVAFEA